MLEKTAGLGKADPEGHCDSLVFWTWAAWLLSQPVSGSQYAASVRCLRPVPNESEAESRAA